MIPKADILAAAQQDGVLASTVEKDYALGWLLYGIAQHPALSRWVFKGGTCLKKCFFETYRFSEDLDFTVPEDAALTEESVRIGLAEVCDWVSTACGIGFPADRLSVESYTNKQGTESVNAKVGYTGPLKLPRGNLQRVKFDLTQREVLVSEPERRSVFHRYNDRIEPPPVVACYSVNEILAEKTRALYERRGRARDVYDVVNINRNFRDDIAPSQARDIVKAKFAFKQLPEPQVTLILDRVDFEGLRVAWQQQLSDCSTPSSTPHTPTVHAASIRDTSTLPFAPRKPITHAASRRWLPSALSSGQPKPTYVYSACPALMAPS